MIQAKANEILRDVACARAELTMLPPDDYELRADCDYCLVGLEAALPELLMETWIPQTCELQGATACVQRDIQRLRNQINECASDVLQRGRPSELLWLTITVLTLRVLNFQRDRLIAEWEKILPPTEWIN